MVNHNVKSILDLLVWVVVKKTRNVAAALSRKEDTKIVKAKTKEACVLLSSLLASKIRTLFESGRCVCVFIVAKTTYLHLAATTTRDALCGCGARHAAHKNVQMPESLAIL
jgi:hypothetical protein